MGAPTLKIYETAADRESHKSGRGGRWPGRPAGDRFSHRSHKVGFSRPAA